MLTSIGNFKTKTSFIFFSYFFYPILNLSSYQALVEESSLLFLSGDNDEENRRRTNDIPLLVTTVAS